jgi:hypothetical protein
MDKLRRCKMGEKKKKGFIARILEKLDKKMEEKAAKSSCCCGPDKKKGQSCC